jgi:hypothetical protein
LAISFFDTDGDDAATSATDAADAVKDGAKQG